MSGSTQPAGITDHSLFMITPYDHHPEVESARLQINGLSIPPGDYEKRITWTRSSHRITEAILAGQSSTVPGGRHGAWGMGTQVSGQSNARFLSGAGVYTYLASFSRLHGDTYLSSTIFGNSIVLKDIYLDGADTVLLFTNLSALSQSLYCWGLVTAK